MNRHPLSIRELAAKYGLSLRTLRFYEEKGLLAPVHINQQRLFSASDEIRLQLVLCGKRLGMTLQEVQALILANGARADSGDPGIATLAALLTEAELVERIASLSRQKAEIEAALAELRTAMNAHEPSGMSATN